MKILRFSPVSEGVYLSECMLILFRCLLFCIALNKLLSEGVALQMQMKQF